MHGNNILSIKSQEFLKNQMHISTSDLIIHIVNNISNSNSLVSDFIEFFIELQLPYIIYSNHVGAIENIKNKTYLNQKFDDYIKKYNIGSKDYEYKIIDLLRHAFINFREGGILQLYQGRETEGWYPKVICDEYIGIEEHIDELDDEITIYRGTTIDEFESKEYGQSWTLDEKIATRFPLSNYESADNERIVLKTNIHKDAIYFYDKHGVEKEVIIDTHKINLITIRRDLK